MGDPSVYGLEWKLLLYRISNLDGSIIYLANFPFTSGLVTSAGAICPTYSFLLSGSITGNLFTKYFRFVALYLLG